MKLIFKMKIIFCAVLLCFIHFKLIAQDRIVFQDKFDDNTNKWEEISNKSFLVDIAKGVLHIEKLQTNKDNRGCLWYKKTIPDFDTKNDFDISFKFRYISTDDVYDGIDFQWGNISEDFYQLSINVQGEVRIQKFTKSNPQKWGKISSAVVLDVIKRRKYNSVNIKYENGVCVVSINERIFIDEPISAVCGKYIGFQQCLKTAWEMDDLIIEQ